ncbi:MAG: hypothetical protein K6T83_12480 [Alicyclobacillus sp.]|nr:hypothetical protein [Alicyclobacillus sp.]
MSRVRLVPVVFIVILSLAVLFTGWRVYMHFNLISPLQTQVSSIQGVKSVQVVSGNPPQISVTLGQVKDLQTTYQAIEQTVTQTLGTKVVIVLANGHNPKLMPAFESIEPLINQGIESGEYPRMIAEVERQARAAGLTARVTMDKHNIYVQLAKGTQQFYDVWPFSLH